MNDRVKKLKERLQVEEYPVCIEKARLIMEMYKKHEGNSPILRRAKATAYYLDNRTIFIEDDELVEVTPKHIRLRKKDLTENARRQASKKKLAT